MPRTKKSDIIEKEEKLSKKHKDNGEKITLSY